MIGCSMATHFMFPTIRCLKVKKTRCSVERRQALKPYGNASLQKRKAPPQFTGKRFVLQI